MPKLGGIAGHRQELATGDTKATRDQRPQKRAPGPRREHYCGHHSQEPWVAHDPPAGSPGRPFQRLRVLRLRVLTSRSALRCPHAVTTVIKRPGGADRHLFVDRVHGAVSYTHLTLPT